MAEFCRGGGNYAGQVGDGTRVDRTMPVLVQNLNGSLAFATGGAHSLAVTSGGVLWAWGVNTWGQLGNGTDETYRTSPTISSVTNVSGVAASGFHSLAVREDGTVWAWGNNEYGQLGIDSAEVIDHSAPLPVPGLENVIDVSAGPIHTVAINQGGNIWAWGSNQGGQLGDGTNTDRTTPVMLTGITDVTTVSAGLRHTLALTENGTAWAWGWNSVGQLGDGTKSNRTSPVKISSLTTVSAVAAGQDFSLALKLNGSVWAWGDNTYGQLGDGTTANHSAPAQVIGLTGVKAISAGYGHALALKQDGTVLAWGYNYFGQLGDGRDSNRHSPAQIAGLSGVIAISAGTGHSLALKQDGTVWAWGSNLQGELGIGTDTPNSTFPVQVRELNGVTAIAASSGFHSAALRQDGTVWTWGWNLYGQLGNGLYEIALTPQLVVNESLTGFLDLLPTTSNAIPTAAIPKFLLAVSKVGDLNSLSLDSNVYLGAIDLGDQTMSLRTNSSRLQSSQNRYKIYVAALVPGGLPVQSGFYFLNSDANWSYYSGGALPEYLSNIDSALTSHVDVSILESVNVSSLIGAQIYVGYGTDDQEMISAGRYRPIYTVKESQ